MGYGLLLIFGLACGWIGLAVLGVLLRVGPRDDVESRLSWWLARLYCAVVHRLRVEGAEHLPTSGPLIVVPNHTAGVDPILIQSACPFYIRWMMMREMMLPWANPLWNWIEIIPVEQNGRDARALRAAIRHLDAGGVVGVFPEGGIAEPHGTVMPFEPGVGMLALRKGVRVLPVVICGTPRCAKAYTSLIWPSRAIVRFLPVRTYFDGSKTAGAIATELRAEAMRELGWPASPGDRE